DGAAGGEETLGEGPDAVQIAEVQFVDLDPVEAGERLLGGGAATGGHDHPGTGSGERPGGLQTQPRVAAGDDRELSGEVDTVQDLLGGAAEAESRTDLVLCAGVLCAA